MKTLRFIKYGIRYLVYSNIFIALCSAAYTAKTSLLLFGNNGNFHVNITAFCGILLFYCFHRINKKHFLSPNEKAEDRLDWMSTHKSIYYLLIGISLLTLFIQAYYMPVKTWLVFIPVGLMGVGYTFPIIPTAAGFKRLRDIYWLKVVWISFSFSWLMTFLPVLFIEPITYLLKPEVLFVFVRSFLFIFAICIPFDIRDMSFDKLKGVNTLPVSFGAKASINIGITLLLFFSLLVGVEYFYFNLNIRIALALCISAIITVITLPIAKTKRPALIFPLLYDGAMLLQWILVFVFIRL
jgi:4-hydroxybenzoate polyprenyltransferase